LDDNAPEIHGGQRRREREKETVICFARAAREALTHVKRLAIKARDEKRRKGKEETKNNGREREREREEETSRASQKSRPSNLFDHAAAQSIARRERSREKIRVYLPANLNLLIRSVPFESEKRKRHPSLSLSREHHVTRRVSKSAYFSIDDILHRTWLSPLSHSLLISFRATMLATCGTEIDILSIATNESVRVSSRDRIFA